MQPALLVAATSQGHALARNILSVAAGDCMMVCVLSEGVNDLMAH